MSPSLSESQQPWLISLLPPSDAHKRAALAVSTVLLVAFVLTVPFAKVMLPHLDIYMPLVATVMFMNDVMTASLLVAHFSVVRSRALLLLANGYLFTALVVAVYGLVWPGAFHPTGLFGAGPQTRPWLYLAWHAGLPMSVIGYALLKSKEPKTVPVAQASVRTFTLASIACTVLIVCGVTWFVTRFEDILPVLVTPIIQTSELPHFVYGPVLFVSFAAFVLQWRRRQRSVLDLWLSVVTLAWLFGSITLNAIGGRYDVAWYAITAFSIVSATLVLLILFSESAVLYAQLAIAEVALRTLNETLEHRVQAETRERLQIWNVSQDLLVIAGLDGKALSVNPAWTATLGWSEADLLGQSSQWLLHPDDRDSTRAELDHLAQGHKMWRFENRLRAKDGSYRWISWKAAPDSGRIYSMGRDITEHKWAEDARARAEGELQQARTALAHRQRISMLGEVAAALAHEIRQPIAAATIDARVCASALSDERFDVEAARAAASRMVKDATWADDIIKRTSALYKKDSTREHVDINAVIREMVLLFQQEACASSTSIRTNLAERIPDVMADRVQLQQVFMNLMLNAIDAMRGTGGELAITSQMTEGTELLIGVSDTGIGLPADNPEQIFESFVTTKPHGTGMGLTITRSIVESHGGRLWATANAGPGATFLFTLLTEAGVPRPLPQH